MWTLIDDIRLLIRLRREVRNEPPERWILRHTIDADSTARVMPYEAVAQAMQEFEQRNESGGRLHDA